MSVTVISLDKPKQGAGAGEGEGWDNSDIHANTRDKQIRNVAITWDIGDDGSINGMGSEGAGIYAVDQEGNFEDPGSESQLESYIAQQITEVLSQHGVLDYAAEIGLDPMNMVTYGSLDFIHRLADSLAQMKDLEGRMSEQTEDIKSDDITAPVSNDEFVLTDEDIEIMKNFKILLGEAFACCVEGKDDVAIDELKEANDKFGAVVSAAKVFVGSSGDELSDEARESFDELSAYTDEEIEALTRDSWDDGVQEDGSVHSGHNH